MKWLKWYVTFVSIGMLVWTVAISVIEVCYFTVTKGHAPAWIVLSLLVATLGATYAVTDKLTK